MLSNNVSSTGTRVDILVAWLVKNSNRINRGDKGQIVFDFSGSSISASYKEVELISTKKQGKIQGR